MNQHIQLLVQQAQILTDKFQEQWKAGPSTEEFFHEKFVELIVQECAQIAEDVGGDYRARKIMLKHFGVEP